MVHDKKFMMKSWIFLQVLSLLFVSAFGLYCSSSEFKCVQSQQCISPNWVCDGYADCEDQTDETNCGEDVTDAYMLASKSSKVDQGVTITLTIFMLMLKIMIC